MNDLSDNEKSNSTVKRDWDNYCHTTFSAVNKLSQEEFENTAIGYDRVYGKLLPTHKAAKIIDIGCGAGHFLFYLQKRATKII